MLLAVVVGVLFFDPTGWGKYVLVGLAIAGVAIELAGLIKLHIGFLVFAGAAAIIRSTTKSIDPIWGVGDVILGTALLCYTTRLGFATILSAYFMLFGSAIGLFGLVAISKPFPAILTAAIPIWAGDTAAIFAGKAFGTHKLAPSISPNKTWEGSIANLLAAVVAAAALGYFLKYPMDKMLLLGVSCGVIGQLGDLFESYLKRQAGVKDSGNLLPGHGGVFDRLDSLLMTAPFSYWILSSFLK